MRDPLSAPRPLSAIHAPLSAGTRRAFIARGTQALMIAAVAFRWPEALDASDQAHYRMPAADGVTIDRAHEVILVRTHGQVIAFNLSCPHENAALRWRADQGRFRCPKHDSTYQPDGHFIDGRATRHMDRLGITRAGNEILVDLSRMYRSDLNPAEWAAAVVTL
jgi:Rieske Fe-S protein